jgi:prepilin-type N-terminal cleavage/methylation domain-containing protein
MLRMLAYCRRNKAQPMRGRLGGFTLLEILMVMTLMALMAAISAPNLFKWWQRSLERQWMAGVVAKTAALPRQAFFSGIQVHLQEELRKGSQAPLGCTYRTEPKQGWAYEPRGWTEGGTIVLACGASKQIWRVAVGSGELLEAIGER